MDRKNDKQLKILIADDDLEITELLKFTFEAEGYNVTTANDGEEALKKIDNVQPDMVVLDVNMPKLTGFEVCEKIRKNISTRLIPVILLTSLSKAKDKLTGLKLGADDFINKPFEPYELVFRVESLVRRIKESISANPLTGLPGNVSFETELKIRLDNKQPFSLIYADIDNFKSFNDKYGFGKGDNFLCFFAGILISALKEAGNKTDFLGHLGGDDFVIITSHDKTGEMSDKIIKDFNSMAPLQYDTDVRSRGYMWGIDRQGNETKFPLVTISVGAVLVELGVYGHYSQVFDKARELLIRAKLSKESNIVVG